MAIVDVTRMWSRAGGAIRSDDGQDFEISFQDAYQVVHDKDTSPLAIMQHFESTPGLPWLGTEYPNLSGVFCTGVGDITTIGPLLSVVPVAYGGSTGPTGDNPLTKPPKITRGNQASNEPVDSDDYGFPLCNAVGDPVQGITDDVSDMALNVERNFASINMAVLQPYLRSVNSDTFDQWAPGQCKLKEFNAEEISYGSGQTYQKVRARVVARFPFQTTNARAWWKRYRNEGLRKRVGPTIEFADPPAGGLKAQGYAVTSSAGAITGIAVTNPGSGYAASSTVAITITDPAGTGATAEGTTNGNGLVTGVTVLTGGSDYRSRVVKAVDSNKEPVTTPVLLDFAGNQIFNSDQATWIERPVNVVPLPYSTLGLLS